MSRETDAWMAEAAAHFAAGDYRDAADKLRLVLQREPAHAAAATQLAEIEIEHGLHANAVGRLLGVLRARPRFAPALAAMARACMMMDRLDEALVHVRDACAQDPGEPRYRLMEARILLRSGQAEAARSCLAPLLAMQATRPDMAGAAHGVMGELLEARGDPAAVDQFRSASLLLPFDADLHMSYGIGLLRAGRFAEGWDEYAWRFRTLSLRRQALALPDELLWNGQPLRGRTIVVTDEQGIGDAIQFFRYVPMVASLGPARLIHVAFPALAPLFRAAAPVVEVMDQLPFGTDLNYHSTTMGLARVFQTRVESIPAPVPYLYADPGRVAAWTTRLQGEARPRVGLTWSGNPKHTNDRHRSIAAEQMLRLTTLPGSYFALQPDLQPSDAAAVESCTALRRIAGEFKDFADTAAAIAAMDLVITVDTAVAHLAGALGKPVWLLLPPVADWRWLQAREDSPWYPTAHLFRAGHDGWQPVLDRVAAALRAIAG